MKTLTMIEMEGCPYCANAHRAMEALRTEGYEDVQVAFIGTVLLRPQHLYGREEALRGAAGAELRQDLCRGETRL